MPDLEIEDILQTALDAVRGKKTQAKLDEALSRKFSLADLREAYANASDDEKAEFREMFGGTPSQVVDKDTTTTEPKPKPKRRLQAAPPPPKETREGRKSGRAYNWTVDDDGRVVQLDTARVYSGADEDDEIELPPPAPEDDDETDETDETDDGTGAAA